MKNYEITFITKEDLKEKPVSQIIESLGGKITKINSLGSKNFAYKIRRENKGFYTTVVFEIEPEKVADLNKKLGLEEEILRFLIINVKPAQELTAKVVEKSPETEIKEQIETAAAEIEPEKTVAAEAKKEKSVEKEKKIVKTKIEKVSAAKATEVKPKKVSKVAKELIEEPTSEEERMEALDKKLEELLKE